MKKSDSSLRFYYEVLGLDRLHYGLWDGEPMSFEGLKKAQERYEARLAGIIGRFCEKAPGAPVLDVGCGSGMMVKTLRMMGYDAEGLSPDPCQQKIFREKTDALFHLCRFEDFAPVKKYPAVLMSESAQYIGLDALFPKAAEALDDRGILVVADYFVKENASGPQARSGHGLEEFTRKASESGFAVESREDITGRTAPTLDFAMHIARGYVLPALDILGDKYRRKHPFAFRLAALALGGRVKKIREEMALIDSGEFKKNKRYMVYVFRKTA